MADEATKKIEKTEPGKPGKKTSEHMMTYVAMAAAVAIGVVAELGLPEAHWAVKVCAMLAPIVGSSVYTFGRSGVKKAEAQAPKYPK